MCLSCRLQQEAGKINYSDLKVSQEFHISFDLFFLKNKDLVLLPNILSSEHFVATLAEFFFMALFCNLVGKYKHKLFCNSVILLRKNTGRLIAKVYGIIRLLRIV